MPQPQEVAFSSPAPTLMARVLVTGATGFLGSYIARLLVKHNYTVTAIHRASSSLELVQSVHSKIQWVECELSDIRTLEDLVADTDFIIHCAALISWHPKDRKRLYAINVQATHDLVNLAILHSVQKFIHISSVAALGKSGKEALISESAEWIESKLNTDYGITKHLAELEIWRAKAEGLSTLIINPSLILGAGFWNKGTSALFSKLSNWNPFFPKGSTGIVDVRDVALITIKAMESSYSGIRVLATGHNISYKSLISSISTALGNREPWMPISNFLINLLPFFDAIQCLLTRKTRTISKTNLRASSIDSKYSNKKSTELFDHHYLPFEKTIVDTVAAYKESQVDGRPGHILRF